MGTSAPRIVCVGGGHGLSAALRAARDVSPSVSAVVTTADDGGSSGILRRQLGIPAPGDLRMAIAALAADGEREALLQYRFREGELAGHPLGNLLIAALADLREDFAKAVAEVAVLAGVNGRVIPATPGPVTLAARVQGADITGQVAIARGPAAVERLWLDPADAAAHEAAIEELERADLVVLGPGSLFTSVIAALLPRGMTDAVNRGGHVALVLNIAQQNGETLGMDAAAHVRAVTEHLPGLRLDAVLAHDGAEADVPRALLLDDDVVAAIRPPVVRGDLSAGTAAHDPAKLAAMLKALLA